MIGLVGRRWSRCSCCRLALQIAAFAAPFQMQLVVDEALRTTDRDLLLVLALGFGALVVIQAVHRGAARLGAARIRPSPELPDRRQSGAPPAAPAERLLREAPCRRHHLAAWARCKPIQDAITQGVVSAVIDGLMACVAAVILFFYSPTLALIVIAAVLLNLAIVARLLFPRMRSRMEEEILAEAKEQTHLMETVRAATTLKLMGREAERESAWRNLLCRDDQRQHLGRQVPDLAAASSKASITGLQTVIVIYLAARMILGGQGFSVGMLFSFLSFRQTFTDRAIGLVNQVMQFRFLRLHLDRLADIVTDAARGRPRGAPQRARSKGPCALKDVSFRYGATDPLVLEDVNLEIEPRRLRRHHRPLGRRQDDAAEAAARPQPADRRHRSSSTAMRATPESWRAWRQHVGVVAQDDRLLSGTIADNIACFDPDLDMQRVQAAAVAAQVHDDIMRTPMQYLTLVGDMGSTLVGRPAPARAARARALPPAARSSFLDEGTANLDESNEELIADLIAADADHPHRRGAPAGTDPPRNMRVQRGRRQGDSAPGRVECYDRASNLDAKKSGDLRFPLSRGHCAHGARHRAPGAESLHL